MNMFKIGDTDFGIGKVSFSVKNDLLDLDITGSDDVFDKLMEDDNSEWSWALYPPRLYLRGVPFKGNELVIDDDLLNNYDITLYIMEHNDFTGTLKVTDTGVEISGKAYMDGEVLELFVRIEKCAIWR